MNTTQELAALCANTRRHVVLLLLAAASAAAVVFLSQKHKHKHTQDAMSWLAVHFIYTKEQMEHMQSAAAAAGEAAAAQEAGVSTGDKPHVVPGKWHWHRMKRLHSRPKC